VGGAGVHDLLELLWADIENCIHTLKRTLAITMRLTGPRQEIRNLQRAHPSLGELKEAGLAGDPCSFHFTAAPTPKRRPGTLVLQNWLRSLKMPEKRRLRVAVSGLMLWLRNPLYGESFTVIETLTLSHPAASGR
jgi:hypothetical protein